MHKKNYPLDRTSQVRSLSSKFFYERDFHQAINSSMRYIGFAAQMIKTDPTAQAYYPATAMNYYQ